MIKQIEDIPSVFLHYSITAAVQLVAVGGLLAVFGALAYYGLNSVPPMPELSIGAGVLVLAGLLAGVIIILAVRRSFHAAHDYYLFETDRMRRDQEALLREPLPQPYVIEERPIIVNGQAKSEAPRLINGVPEIAYEYFVAQVCRGVSHAQSRWDRFLLPGDFEIASFEAYDKLVAPLVELGIIAGRDGDKRKSGRLTTTDKDLIMSRLREWEARRQLRS